MARSVVLSNGRLAVGLDETGLVHDFYYPYVGLENLTTARSIRHRIGVWVDGTFSWTDDSSWTTRVNFSADALISSTVMSNKSLGVTIKSQDFVDYEYDVFCRLINVINDSDQSKEVRLFMHQVFEISSDGRADTALYEPDGQYILDYKGRCCLLISGYHQNGEPFDQFAVGNYGIEGKQGTYMDAEDGELSGHPVEHGGVDSVIRFSSTIEPGQEQQITYYVVAGDSQYECDRIHARFRDDASRRLETNQLYWQQWLSISSERLSKATPEQQAFARKSLMVIKAHTDARGGVIASCDSSIYNYGRDYYSYVWPRDGAYAMWPLIRLGYTDEPRAFFKFCADIATNEGYLMHKYQPDRSIGSTWHPLVHGKRRELAIQEDETAIIIVLLGEYLDYSKDEDFVKEMFENFVVKSANFMASYIDKETGLPHASYDLWEEKFLTTTYSTAIIYQALIVACELAEKFGRSKQQDLWLKTAQYILSSQDSFLDPDTETYRKGFLLQPDGTLKFDNTIDISSMYAVMTYSYYDEDHLHTFHKAAGKAIDKLLDAFPAGGAPRYENDGYFRVSEDFPGNPWIISSLWIAQYYIRCNRYDEAADILSWVQSHALPSGVLPEQIHPVDGSPVSVTPLVWSHAEYINTVLDLAYKQNNQA
jgi:GH15 family glucan-1,4-alpha-glucosidase